MDLKMLGKRDFRLLLAWRLKAAEAWRKHEKALARGGEDGEEGEEEEVEEMDPDEKLDDEISELERMAEQRRKALKRKEAERRRRMKASASRPRWSTCEDACTRSPRRPSPSPFPTGAPLAQDGAPWRPIGRG